MSYFLMDHMAIQLYGEEFHCDCLGKILFLLRNRITDNFIHNKFRMLETIWKLYGNYMELVSNSFIFHVSKAEVASSVVLV